MSHTPWPMKIEILERTIRAAWSCETSYTPERWSAERPATGQCAITALLVHDETGARILKTHTAGETHFYNELDGVRFDLTVSQFDAPPLYEDLPVDPEHLRNNPATPARYALLRQRFNAAG